jgi:hypothetical protein
VTPVRAVPSQLVIVSGKEEGGSEVLEDGKCLNCCILMFHKN